MQIVGATGLSGKAQFGELSLETPAGWKTVESIQNNHQRLRRHLLASNESVTALRLHITATSGLDHARVVEVRAYE